MSEERDIFEEIGASSANQKGDNIKDGKGVFLVRENIYAKLNDGPTFIARVRVLKVEPKVGTGVLAPFEPGKPHQEVMPFQQAPPNAIGEDLGWVQKPKKHKSAKGNIKSYVLALFGKREQDVSKAEFADTVTKLCDLDPTTGQPLSAGQCRNPAAGFLIAFSTYRQVTATGANVGRVNTYVKFEHVEKGDNPDNEWSNHPVQIAKRRAALGLVAA